VSDLEQALEVFHRYGFEYGEGTPSYGPMAAAALVELGHDALITGVVDIYAPRLAPRPPGDCLADAEQREALGDAQAFSHWVASYQQQLEHAPWQEVLASAVRLLTSGLGSRSMHGLVRVGYAVTALEAAENGPRRDELAFGLAHWAATFESPENDAMPRADTATRAALDQPIDRLLERACRAGADRYLDHLDQRMQHIHGIMVPSALGRLTRYLDAATQARAWQALRRRALLVDFVDLVDDDAPEPPDEDARVDEEVARCAQSRDETRYRAACSIQEQAITFAAACLREDARCADARLRNAAADGALRLSPPGYREWR